MSQIPDNLHYTKEDEWVSVEDGIATIGVTDYAQDALSDIVYLELPEVGATVTAGNIFGVIESVKAASDLYSPIDGEVVAMNTDLLETPETVNEDPYGEAWLLKIKLSDPSQVEGLMDAEAYTAYNEDR